MSKNARFRRPLQKQHIKCSKLLSKSAQQHLQHIYWSIWMKFSWKKFFLVICKILWLFLSPLTADDKYSLPRRDNITQPIHMQLSSKQKTFCYVLLQISNVHQILNISETKMTLISYVFPKLRTAKDVVR